MRFPSLTQVLQQTGQVLLRFPFTLISSAVGAFAFSYQQHYRHWETEYHTPEWTIKLLLTSFLALSLTLSLHILAERRHWSEIKSMGLQAGALALLTAYYFWVNPDFDEITGTRFFLFLLGLHLLVAFSPYIAQREEPHGFWQFNKRLFLRILLAGLYSVVLYAGMALALLAIENLFDVKIEGKWYATLAAVIFGPFNTGFFLAGIPQQWEELEQEEDYPKGLLLFTQFVLLPLVTIYLVILYLYSGKILIQQTLPKGWVSYLVLGFSIAGILSLLLIHPIRRREGNRWIQTFSRWFYLALFPLLVLLFVAISERIKAYGITEKRYLVLVLACWLVGIASYFLFNAVKNIYWIPASLCVLTFVVSFGPWSVFQVSVRSQLGRLDDLLRKNNLLENGKIVGKNKKVNFEDNRQISSLFDYFAQRRSVDLLQPYFQKDMSLLDTLERYRISEVLHESVDLRYVNSYDREDNHTTYYNFYNSSEQSFRLTSIAGFDYFFTLYSNTNEYNPPDRSQSGDQFRKPYVFRSDADSIVVRLDSAVTVLKFYHGSTWLATEALMPRIEALSQQYPTNQDNVKDKDLSWLVENERCRIQIQLLHVRFQKTEKGLEDIYYQANVLIDLKEK